MEYNQLKQYGTAIHEDTPTTSTPVARMIPSTIDAKYAKLFLAAPALYEALEDCIPEIAYLATTRLDETQEYYVKEIESIVNKALAQADKEG